jgi:hypothetical protein
MATRKKKSVAGPSVVKGTHLTVYTYEDGSTKLEWDDEQLLKEVREAIASVKPGKVYIVEVPDMIETVTTKVVAKLQKAVKSKKTVAKKKA